HSASSTATAPYPLPLHDALPISWATSKASSFKKAAQHQQPPRTRPPRAKTTPTCSFSGTATGADQPPPPCPAWAPRHGPLSPPLPNKPGNIRSQEHTSALQSRFDL